MSIATVATEHEQAERYIRSIRNKAKRQYAETVWGCMTYSVGVGHLRLPDRPHNLSLMGAQAVEMRLAEIRRAAA